MEDLELVVVHEALALVVEKEVKEVVAGLGVVQVMVEDLELVEV